MPRKPSKMKSFKWEEALTEFLLVKQADGRAPRTLKDYEKQVTHLFRSYPDASKNYDNLRRCVLNYLSQSVAAATRNIRLSYLKAFFNWCVERRYLPENPVAGIKKSRDDGDVRHLSLQDVKKLLSQPKKNTYTGLRDYCMMLMQLDTAIRPGEMLQLKLQDINLDGMEIYVRSSVAKTRISRTLPISPFLAQILVKFLKARPQCWGTNVPVFASERGNPLTSHWWSKRFKFYAKKAGVNASPYCLRHTAAIELLRGGANAFFVQRLLGHTDLKMTKRYVNLSQEDLKEVHAFASPLQKLIQTNMRAKRKLE